MTRSRVALVTGATQGLGLALVEGLAAGMRPDDQIFLTGRDPDRIAAEADRLATAGARVHGLLLDVTDPDSVRAAADTIARRYGGVDIVFSNAGFRMSPDRTPAEQVDLVARTYNLGTTRMLRAFGPILRPGGRYLVVASAYGTLGYLDPRVRPEFEAARSLEDIDAIVESWRAAVHDGSAQARGWPEWLNIPSKVAQVAAVRVVAAQRRERDLADGTLVAAVCPGLIDTAASRPWFADMSSAQTPRQAATALLDLARSPSVDPGHYGELVQFGKVLPWLGTSATSRGAQTAVSSSATAPD
jgi:NAD(P)-dependent dehydrogenase (short-subunit alcohol dehydrogenase family)